LGEEVWGRRKRWSPLHAKHLFPDSIRDLSGAGTTTERGVDG
jgi:hypothetical protein